MKLAIPMIALFLCVMPCVTLVGCLGDTGTLQDKLPRYSDMGAAEDAGKVKGE